jgi:hypothetical protein
MPVISATWRVETRGSELEPNLDKVNKPLSQKLNKNKRSGEMGQVSCIYKALV